MNELSELVFILDRSGSMHGLESDTIGGFNSMIENQRKDGVKGVVTTVLFDSGIEIPFDRVDLSEIPEMTSKIYFTRGCTALFDAVGSAIQRVLNQRRFLTPDQIPGKTIFVITTDGLENASREFSGQAVKRLIEEQKEAGWEFLYLGANVDAAAEADRIGISADRAVRFHADSRGVRKNYETLSCAVSFMSRHPDEQLDESWADEIRRDFKSRKSDR